MAPTYENGPGRLFRFTAATLAQLSDGETLGASQAASVLTIPDHAQGAAIGGGGLWIARSDWSWGTLDRLDPSTGAPQRRYEIAPGTEGIAFGSAGQLWSAGCKTNIARARQLIAAPMAEVDPPAVHDTADPRTTTDHRPPCPCCGGRMIIVEPPLGKG
jgi:hypothetical protein